MHRLCTKNIKKQQLMIIKNFNSPAEKWMYCQQDRQLPAIMLPQPYGQKIVVCFVHWQQEILGNLQFIESHFNK